MMNRNYQWENLENFISFVLGKFLFLNTARALGESTKLSQCGLGGTFIAISFS